MLQEFNPTRKSVPCFPECTGPLNEVSRLMLKGRERTNPEERKTPLITNPFECRFVNLFCRNICCVLYFEKSVPIQGTPSC